MPKQVLKKPTRKISDTLLVVTLLLPFILYIVYFWRSGVFTDVSSVSSVFKPGEFNLLDNTILHTPGSFGEFFNGNFVVSEVNTLFITPIVYAVDAISGYVSPESAYLIYTVCGYLSYVMIVYLAILIFKLLTFVPCVIISFVNKATGGD